MINLGDTLEVFNPIRNTPHITTLTKLRETYRVVDSLIQSLDDAALGEIYGGCDNDVNKLFDVITKETYETLYGTGGLVKEDTFFYLERLTQNIDECFRVENLNYFIVTTLSDFEMNWHHLEWGQLSMLYRRLGVLAARDHGKSYFFSHAVPIWRMYRAKSMEEMLVKRKDLANSRVGYIITNEMDLGVDFLENIKSTIESTPILKERLYPGSKEGWGKERIVCKNNARLSIKSYGSKFRGRHPGYIIIDDFLSDAVIYSETQRKKVTDYFYSVIMNAIVPGGNVTVVGTPFHQADLYGDLKIKKNWKVFEYPSIFPDGRILWSNRYSFKDLMNKKEELGNMAFSREMLVKPIISDSSLFPYDLLQRSFIGMQDVCLVTNRESCKIKYRSIVVGCDFAISANIAADYSVFITAGVTDTDEIHLLNIYRAKGRSYFEQIAVLKSIRINFNPEIFMMEDNQFQMIFAQGATLEGLPVVSDTTGTNKYDWKKGLPSLEILFERGKIKMPRGDDYSRKMTDLACSELASITWTDGGLEGVGTHDDIPMALWQVVKATRRVTGSGFSYGFL